MNRALRTLTLSATALATASALAACGSSGGSPSGSQGMPGMPGMSSSPAPSPADATGQRNAADVAFATQMIPHHAQAVVMAEMALAKTSNATVKELATAIKNAQNPEIQTMTGWLKAWGQPVPTPMGADMPSMAGDGMMSAQEMADLGKASGTAFDRMWLQLMTKHHENAVAMAKTELGAGQDAEAKKLAQEIIDGQTKEITQMTALLATLPG